MVVTITHTGYIKTTPAGLYRSQRRGGKGRIGIAVKDEDFVEHIYVASTYHHILFFTDRGKLYWLKVHQVPQAAPSARGKALVNLIDVSPHERITAIMPLREFTPGTFVVMATRNGIIKKTSLEAFSNPRSNGIIALHLDEGDSLVGARLAGEKSEIFLGTKNGKATRFSARQVRPMGRIARGVRGVKLAGDDHVVALEILEENATILTITEHGYGKRTRPSEYRLQHRGGKGVINTLITPKNGHVVGILQVVPDDEIMVIADQGSVIRIRVSDVPLRGRHTIGVKLIGLQEEERTAGLAKLAEQDKKGLTGSGFSDITTP